MNIQTVARSDDVTAAERSYAEEKVAKLPRYFDHIHSAEIILEKDKERSYAEVIVAAGKDHTFVGKVTNEHLVAAIDLVMDKLERQVKKYKEQLTSHRSGNSSTAANQEQDEPSEPSYEEVVERELG